MSEALAHRGPDGLGRQQLGFANFGHRRLSIIDLSDASAQPFLSACRRYMLSFNGEIYNYLDLRRELLRLGHDFRSNGDAEVLLTAYAQWGQDCLARLNGMFAFAIWDQSRRELFLARDRLGEKSLYYAQEGDQFAFASEPGALSMALPQRAGNVNALVQYLYLNYTIGDNCIERGLKRLPAGSWMRVTYTDTGGADTVASGRYWCPSHGFHNKISISEADAVEQLVEILQDAVKLRMISDRPLGCLLSGGLDSSAILSLMAEAGPENLRSFTTKFSEEAFDESVFAQLVATHIGSRHSVEVIGEATPAEILRSAQRCGSEPFADTSFLAMESLCRFASSRVTVGLTGDGADEILGGYPTLRADEYADRIPFGHGAVSRLLRIAADLLPLGRGAIPFGYKFRKFAENLDAPSAVRHQAWRSIFSLDEIRSLLTSECLKNFDEQKFFETLLPINDSDLDLDLVDLGLLLDQKTWLPENILIKSDRASMAHGFELRAPFLDHRVVEFTASLPTGLKVNGRKQKYLLRKAFADRLPTLTHTRKKQGYTPPVARWLFGSLGDTILKNIMASPLSAILHMDSVAELLHQHRSGRRDNSYKLFGLLVLSQNKISDWK